MKALLFFLQCLIFLPGMGYAQGEGNIWMFHCSSLSQERGMIDFNTTTPTLLYPLVLPYNNSAGTYSAPVCYPNGQLRFSVEFAITVNPADSSNKIRNANGDFIPKSNLNLGSPLNIQNYGIGFPIVIPHPGNANQYYIFYSFQNALVYSLLDMALNGGIGGIVPGKKDILLTNVGSIFLNTMTAIKGCNGVWLVVRSRLVNEYQSFNISRDGLDTNAIVSDCGTLPVNDLWSYGSAKLCASPNGKYLASVSRWKGVELYDFEKCSGKIQNARIIDDNTVNNTFPYPWLSNSRIQFKSGCFSPDDSKFYITQERNRDTFIAFSNGGKIYSWMFPGELFQYDLSQSSLPLVVASKKLILTNQPAWSYGMVVCEFVISNPLGDIKLASNGKIYFDNGSSTCYLINNVPPGTNPAGFHVIRQPNLPGLSCQPDYNEIVIPNSGLVGPLDPGFRGDPGSYLPPDIVIAPPLPDTILGNVFKPVVCFLDSLLIMANENGSCYRWDDSSSEIKRTIYKSGTYYVTYFENCTFTTDTFQVRFIPIPEVPQVSFGCPGEGEIIIKQPENDFTLYDYTLSDSNSQTVFKGEADTGIRINGLAAGLYRLNIRTDICDTTIDLQVQEYPKPVLIVAPADTAISYGDTIRLFVSGADFFTWWPLVSLDTTVQSAPLAWPLKPTIFNVIGINEYGCRDTGYVRINIDFTMPDMVPNAFSPNADGLNDIFRIEGLSYQKIGNFSVYNRYGQQVFSAKNGQNGWDGTQRGLPCDAGTYYYSVEILYPDGEIRKIKGDLVLIR